MKFLILLNLFFGLSAFATPRDARTSQDSLQYLEMFVNMENTCIESVLPVECKSSNDRHYWFPEWIPEHEDKAEPGIWRMYGCKTMVNLRNTLNQDPWREPFEVYKSDFVSCIGCLTTSKELSDATKAQVEADMREGLKALSPGGKYARLLCK